MYSYLEFIQVLKYMRKITPKSTSTNTTQGADISFPRMSETRLSLLSL